jgi:hypothetical protein
VNADTIWMWVKFLDKSLKSFIGYSFLLFAITGAIAAVFTYMYNVFTVDVYNNILLISILAAIILMSVVLLSTLSIYIAVKKRRVTRAIKLPVRLGLRFIIPFVLFITGLVKSEKDLIRRLYIDINNLYLSSCNILKGADKILLLLPHCLQNSECTYKITGNTANCMRCGKCSIGGILDMADEKGVKTVVVTGGTAARNVILKEKPEAVVSVACERDLASGISDMSKIPVMGVLNKRPNGPCLNTTVEVDKLREKLESILEHK